MRGLLLFLGNNSSIFLFILLEAVCFYLIVRFNDVQQRVWLTTFTTATGFFHKKSDDIHTYFSLNRQMDALQKENAFLRQQLQRMARMYSDSLLEDTAMTGNFSNLLSLRSGADDTLRKDFTFIPAEVIDNSIAAFDNTLMLNRGKADGVKPHLGVVSGEGVVGIVREVSEHYCTVMSILHRQTRVSASVKRTGAFGVLRWYGGNTKRMQLEDIPQHEKVMKGDTVVTTGYPLSNIFPKGILIGIVDNAYIKPGENFYTVDVTLNINLSSIEHAYVVSLNHQEELLQLEQQKRK